MVELLRTPLFMAVMALHLANERPDLLIAGAVFSVIGCRSARAGSAEATDQSVISNHLNHYNICGRCSSSTMNE